jgi:predicted DCC family thiol-disulfide oxidoreductase YuxK
MVNFAIRNDPNARLRFAVIPSEKGSALRSIYNIDPSIDSVILIDDEKVYVYSDAAIRICRYLRWPVKLFHILIIVPKFIREPVYKWIAANRYKWFGRKDQCMIPTEDIRSRFLS